MSPNKFSAQAGDSRPGLSIKSLIAPTQSRLGVTYEVPLLVYFSMRP
jgi:hypothetical protein